MSEFPNATYIGPGVSKTFSVEDVSINELTADGATTGPSPYLIESTNGTYIDKDKPAELNLDSEMGVLRGYVTRLQDDVNTYLTEKIKAAGQDVIEEEDQVEEEDDSIDEDDEE